jgi:hypothetical protein
LGQADSRSGSQTGLPDAPLARKEEYPHIRILALGAGL